PRQQPRVPLGAEVDGLVLLQQAIRAIRIATELGAGEVNHATLIERLRPSSSRRSMNLVKPVSRASDNAVFNQRLASSGRFANDAASAKAAMPNNTTRF